MYAHTFSDKRIECIECIDTEKLVPAQKTRLLVELLHDGLGRCMRVPIIALRGKRNGPVFGITAALHGNELNGIPLAHELINSLNPEQLRGTVVVVPVINIPGFLNSDREFRDSVDLNHVMPGMPNGNESQVYAFRIVDRIVRHFDYLLDLHTASYGRINTLYVRADVTDSDTATMARLQRPAIILHNPPSDRTLRGAASELGIPAITVEIGDPGVFQPKHVRRALTGVRAVMSHLKMISKRPMVDVPEPILCSTSRWFYTDAGGLIEVFPKLGEIVEQGSTLAIQKDIFGDVVRHYEADVGGVVIGKSVNPVSPTGARIVHLGTIAEPDDPIFAMSAMDMATPSSAASSSAGSMAYRSNPGHRGAVEESE